MEHHRVLLLGASESGKTTYLTMLNRFFETGGSIDRGVSFSVKPRSASERLREKYEILTDDVADRWPPGTVAQEDPEWSFECSVVRQQIAYPVFRLTYLDFAGEWYSEGPKLDRDWADRVFEAMDTATAILLLIDGNKLRLWLSGAHEYSEEQFFKDCIKPTERFFASIQHPMHIVITKWDVLHDEDFSLRQVRDAMLRMKDPWLRSLVSRAKELESPDIRIIPMSSLGNFAIVGDNGKMLKRIQTDPKPFNLTIPMVAVLPDCIRRRAHKGYSSGQSDAVPANLPGSDGAALAILAMYGVAKVSRQIRKAIDRRDLPVRRALNLRRRPNFKDVGNDKSAYLYVVACLAYRLHEFEGDFSASVL